jgi:hypothetical protein
VTKVLNEKWPTTDAGKQAAALLLNFLLSDQEALHQQEHAVKERVRADGSTLSIQRDYCPGRIPAVLKLLQDLLF